MTGPVSEGAGVHTDVDLATALRLLRHEATVHAVPGRDVRDLGDALLLVDPIDPEPFWNRLEAVRFPEAPDAFDQRLAEIQVLFASLGRQPHIWLMPPYDQPADVYDRLVANGFEDAGPGHLMISRDGAIAQAALDAPREPAIAVERFAGLTGATADALATELSEVLLEAFGVDRERQAGVIREIVASLGDARFTHYLIRVDGVAAAVARRATFDGLSYLSSIGTLAAARGRGLGRLVTAAATVDGFAAGSAIVHLGVFANNPPAKALYEHLGFRYVGGPAPDMLFIG
jgi:ribosomal protein S18 acetylase RimI-like enzyme